MRADPGPTPSLGGQNVPMALVSQPTGKSPR
jgi:hypothetical protein